jgi:hypothetical protein
VSVNKSQHARGDNSSVFRNTVTLMAQGVAWGGLAFVTMFILASAAGGSSRALEIGLTILGVAFGLGIAILKQFSYVGVDSSGVRVRRLLRSYHYSTAKIARLTTDMSRARWLRSPLVTVYPYLVLDDGKRVRLTPAGSTAVKLPFTDPQIDGSSADEITTAIRVALNKTAVQPQAGDAPETSTAW